MMGPAGKTAPMPEDPSGAVQRFTKKDCSTALRQSESGMVDQVMLTTNSEGQRFVKMRVRRRPQRPLTAAHLPPLASWLRLGTDSRQASAVSAPIWNCSCPSHTRRGL